MAGYSPCAPVMTESGLLSGRHQPNGTRSFLGIPYAAPPVGDLRWRPPQPPPPWTGVRAGDKFGPASIQPPSPASSIYSSTDTEFSEDCLYLNIYTGGAASDEEGEAARGRPVLVWFHFGAFVFGSGSNPMQDGSGLAARGVTVVTAGFRLGRFGFLALAALSAESGRGASGNYGVMDQIAALAWVRRNVGAFGGDRDNVTVAGASSGGASVHVLRASPLARGLFAKAICESGPGMAPPAPRDGPGHIAAYMTLAAAEDAGSELLRALGVASLADLRAVPADRILAARLPRAAGPWKSYLRPAVTTSLSVYDTANPIVDGYVVPESPLAAFVSGRAADVPLLAGSVADDGTALPRLGTLAAYRAFLEDTFGGRKGAETPFRLYPAATDAEAWTASWRLLAEQVFRWPTWTAARLQSRYMTSPVWYYEFVRAPPIPRDADVVEREFAGAFHLAGMLYAFGNLDVWRWDWSDADRSLSRKMMDAWVRFMRTGSPGGDADGGQGVVDSWPALSADRDVVRIWDGDGSLQLASPGSHAREVTSFWDRYYGVEL